MHAGWWLFGVSEWWPRSVAAIVSLVALLAVSQLAGLLWPGKRELRELVPWILFGFLFWMAFYTWLQLDMLMVQLDEDGDGQVSYDEFVDHLARDTVAPAAMGKRGMLSKDAMGVDAYEMLNEQLGHKKIKNYKMPTSFD